MAEASDRKWHRVSLRLSGAELPVDEIEARLGIAPDHLHRKGEPRGQTGPGEYPEGVWVAELTTDREVPFEEQMQEWLPVLESRTAALREILAMPGVSGELFLGYCSDGGQGWAEFSPDVVRRIAALGLGLTFDLYPPTN